MTDIGSHNRPKSKLLQPTKSLESHVDVQSQMLNVSDTFPQGDSVLVQKSLQRPLRSIPGAKTFNGHPAAQLMDIIQQDPSLGELLAIGAVSGEGAVNTHASSTCSEEIPVMRLEDLPEFRKRLKKVAEEPINNVLFEERRVKLKQSKAQHLNHRSPSMGDWYMKRSNLQQSFIHEPSPSNLFAATLGPVPVQSQENIIMQELLSVLEGNSGVYIVAEQTKDPYATRIFTISNSIDSSISQQVKSILPIASDHAIVTHFIHEMTQFEKGQVNHALSEAMDQIIKKYLVKIAHLETILPTGELTLQILWFYAQEMLTSMKILATVAITISKAKATGGKVLSLLHQLTMGCSGDAGSYAVCLFLIQAASVPYMEMLQKWVHHGVIADPYREFLVEDNQVDKGQPVFDYSVDYWEKQYTVCEDMLPVFLRRVSQVILRTGKYLNVIRQCGKNVSSPLADEMVYTVTEEQYVEAIEKAYAFASQTLLDLLLKDYDLIGRLRSVKHYFLLDQGDFIVQLMDSCEAELFKNMDDIIPTRLEPLLELALRTSAANNDPYKDDMRTQLLPYNIYSQMFKIHSISTNQEEELRHVAVDKRDLTGVKCFAFNYQVRWPVSLVINGQAILCYQMVFRHLFYCKHVERSLCRVWLCDKVAKSFARATSSSYGAAFTLRQRMLNCVQNLEYFMMVEVIEPYWLGFLATMTKVKNVDDVLECHNDFLNNVLKDCMLTSPALLRNVSELMNVCIQFCQFIQSPDAGGDADCGDGQTFEETISKFDGQFTSLLYGLLTRLKELGRTSNSEKLVGILYRLDFNNFYEEKIKQMDGKSISSAGDTSG